MIGAILIVLFILLNAIGSIAYASGLVDTTINTENIYSKYSLDHYQLDFYVDDSWDWLPWNWSDGIGKSVMYGLYAITNFVWTVSLYLSNATGYVIQEAYQLDFISDTADSIGENIQTLAGITSNGFSSEGFYVGFLLIFILIIGIYVAYVGLIKRESSKAIHAVVNFVTVFILSASFIAYAPDYITKINEFSSDISSSALSLGTKIVVPDSETKGKDSVNMIRDSLFSIQVDQPWLLLQYGDSDKETIGADRVENLLSIDPNTNNGKDRESAVKTEINDQDNQNMTLTKTMNRLGTVVFLFLFNLGISIFIFLLTGIMIFSQILFIIFAMFLPISFLLSMLPTYEGMAKRALEKLFNTIMMRAGITLVITTAFSISSMFYSLSGGYPFFMVAFLQIVTFAGIYFKLGDLMSLFRLQSSDSQQLSRRVLRQPRSIANRGARRATRKLSRALAVGGIGAAIVESKKNIPSLPNTNHNTNNTPNFSERMGKKAGTITAAPQRLKNKAKNMKEQAQNLPVNAQYAVVNGLNKPKEAITGFKRGMTEQKQFEHANHEAATEKKRQTIAEKRQALDQFKQKRKISSNIPNAINRRENTVIPSISSPPPIKKNVEKPPTKPVEKRQNKQVTEPFQSTKIGYKTSAEIKKNLIKRPTIPNKKKRKKGGGKGETQIPRNRR
ncbi:FUSC family protein [Enterococcus xiangfangensis]|uniref:FUSC family protein n=1 Tax=Enterococcus xiangfangensis TaxID=1296537 RepID=UPI003D178623|nr:YtxH domain-containing protein [Enterococcus asini]